MCDNAAQRRRRNQPGDLTGTVYGADRTGGSMSWLARDGADHGTLWATTSAGRVFVTHNADAADPAAVVWHRIDNASSPTRFPSSIYPDPADAGRAWITYSGYNAATPTTPGHVSTCPRGPARRLRHLHEPQRRGRDGAFPTPDGRRRPSGQRHRPRRRDGKLYVSTDFGVLRGDNDGTGGWQVSSGLPRSR